MYFVKNAPPSLAHIIWLVSNTRQLPMNSYPEGIPQGFTEDSKPSAFGRQIGKKKYFVQNWILKNSYFFLNSEVL